MSINLEQVVTRFSENLLGFYQAANANLGSLVMPRPRWLRSYLVFSALEKCRDLAADGAASETVYCRFSLGRRTRKNHAELEELLHLHRSLNDAGAIRPERLSEYLVDFTVSAGTLSQARGDSDFPDDARFRLLMAAESELDSDFSKVLEDCLKLLDVVSPFKVMVFCSSSQDGAILRRKERLEKLFNSHDPAGAHQAQSQWLLLGIPTFADWERQDGDVANLKHQVYTLAVENKQYRLPNQTGWTNQAAITPQAG